MASVCLLRSSGWRRRGLGVLRWLGLGRGLPRLYRSRRLATLLRSARLDRLLRVRGSAKKSYNGNRKADSRHRRISFRAFWRRVELLLIRNRDYIDEKFMSGSMGQTSGCALSAS